MNQSKLNAIDKYNKVRPELKTGDIVLFSGKGTFSDIIKFGTGSKWSHVGMVVRTDYGVMIFESTTLSPVEDFESNKHLKGVNTSMLYDRIVTYDGEIGIRKIRKEFTDDQKKIVAKTRKEFRGKPYEINKKHLIYSALDFPGLFENKGDLSSLFCSELVAEIFQRCEMIDKKYYSDEFTPADFGDIEMFDCFLEDKIVMILED